MGKVHFASSTVHSPWTALRVRWVPLYCFPTLSLRAFAMYAVFLHSDYYALFDCLEGFGVSLGSRLPTRLGRLAVTLEFTKAICREVFQGHFYNPLNLKENFSGHPKFGS